MSDNQYSPDPDPDFSVDPATAYDNSDMPDQHIDNIDVDEPVTVFKRRQATANHKSMPAKAPVPASVKLGLALGLVVIVAIAAAVVFYLSSKKGLAPASEDSATLPAISPFEIGGAIGSQDKHAPANIPVTLPPITDNAEVKVEPEIKARADDVGVTMDTLETRYAALLENNLKLNARLDEITASIAIRDQTTDELRIDVGALIDSRIPALIAADRDIHVTLENLRSATDKMERRVLDETRRKAELPPFKVTSIDEWGTTASAVLELNGRPTTASVGDVYSGWRINKIVWPDCIYAVRDSESDSKPVKVCGAGKP